MERAPDAAHDAGSGTGRNEERAPGASRASHDHGIDTTLIILTFQEEGSIGECLASVARQQDTAFRTLIVDAGSTDATVEEAEEAIASFGLDARVHVAEHRLPIGAARNLGVRMTDTPYIMFLSADARLAPDWIPRARAALDRHDAVYGKQVHRPTAWTLGAAVRGLRYQFPDEPTDTPQRYASHVAAGYRREVLEAFPFQDETNASEDVLLAAHARRAGYALHYEPRLVVFHKDVRDAREEWRKMVREGDACGRYAKVIGPIPFLGAWGIAILASLVIIPFQPLYGLALLILVLWAPAARRALRTAGVPRGARLRGFSASPVFDLAFLAHYAKGRVAGRLWPEPILLAGPAMRPTRTGSPNAAPASTSSHNEPSSHPSPPTDQKPQAKEA